MSGSAQHPEPGFAFAAAATLAVAGLLLAPFPPAQGGSGLLGVPHVDKLAHLLLFLFLGWSWHRSLARAGRPVSYLAVFVAVVGYGGLLELLQGASGLRTAEWGDLAADALGAGLVPLWRRPRLQAGRNGAGDSRTGGAEGGVADAAADSR